MKIQMGADSLKKDALAAFAALLHGKTITIEIRPAQEMADVQRELYALAELASAVAGFDPEEEDASQWWAND